MEQRQQIIARCKEVIAKAEQLYNVDLSTLRITFDLRGRAAGMASARRDYRTRALTDFMVRFNHDMLTRDAFTHVLEDTVPHEIAHIVCFANPTLGRNHDHGWARVCRALGGNGERCHSEDVVYGKGNTYEYTTDAGHKVRMSQKLHNNVQQGRTYTYSKGKGRVSKACAYTIVGSQGRTLANPIAGKTPVTKEVPVQAIVPAPVLPSKSEDYPPWWKFNTDNVPAPVLTVPAPKPAMLYQQGTSKAATSRSIMLQGHRDGLTYEQIIAAMMAACGYDRQLARATYKANAAKVGVPLQ